MSDPFRSKAHSLFPTCFITGQVPDADALNAGLKEAIARNRAAHPGIERSNVLGWHSTTDMHLWGGDAALALARHAVAFCDRYTGDRQDRGAPRFSWRAEMWANVSQAGASNQMHCHPGALWSCVYYVDDGYDGPQSEKGGELVLYDPRFPVNRMYAPDLVTRWPDGTLEQDVFIYRPRSGAIVGFPSWMSHGVRPYQGKRERISVAINLTLAPVSSKSAGAPGTPRSNPA